ncbi:MAG: polynucleotide adenylyltransferase PcnB [Candidatus Binataceae bacterium]
MEPSILERAEHPISRRDIDSNVLKVLYRLIAAEHVAYLVGGSVRDLMMGRRPKDFDVATSAHPQQVRDIFRNSRMIGRRFRLVHVFFGAQNIEVATFRRRSEEVLDAGDPMIRQDNTFGTPEEDAFRRDFTINSLFYDPRTFRVIDYTGGVSDLKARLIRTIGDPEVRMREDPVRMIRAVRFAAKLGFQIEEETAAAIRRNCSDLTKASAPRMVEEIFRTVGTAGAAQALVLMERLGLLRVLIEPLSAHLRDTIKADEELESARAVRNLAALGDVIGAEGEQPRPMVLACLFAELHLRWASEPERRTELLRYLQSRGFARGECEQMRLLLDALVHMTALSRHVRRIARRPYFGEARRLLGLVAPVNGVGVEELDRFLTELADSGTYRRPLHSAGPVANGTGRRRRRRRGGRRHRRRPEAAVASASSVSEASVPEAEVADAAASVTVEPIGEGDNAAGGCAEHRER